jgi:hypothetical protein
MFFLYATCSSGVEADRPSGFAIVIPDAAEATRPPHNAATSAMVLMRKTTSRLYFDPQWTLFNSRRAL